MEVGLYPRRTQGEIPKYAQVSKTPYNRPKIWKMIRNRHFLYYYYLRFEPLA